MAKVAVFPASGKIGSSIYTHLFKLLPPKELLLISRYPEKIPSHMVEAGVCTRKADYNDTDSLEHAFDGVACLILISYPSIESDHRFKVHKVAIDAAHRSGVSHVCYTSLAFGGDCTPDSVAHVMQAHLKTESYLKSLESGSTERSDKTPITFTAIREGIYSESFPMYTGFPNPHDPPDEVRIPHDGSGPGIAFAKIDDLGEATAKLVKEYLDSPSSFKYRNQAMLLSGPRVWSLAETVKLLGKLKGKDMKVKQVTEEEYVAEPRVQDMLGSHGPGEVPKQWATSFDAVKKGECAVASIELGRLLGREPEGLEETVGKLVDR
ncbi:hypothetical protein HO133_004117 [Letharia lupina]|uniref:NmrA-like domain-containing protein n=1 Tax=Letharia lupina TaxID=560253 RepID=A0A8H6F9H1_9LECA|nr:uncharacterized protein HO133_004117 [Letharia lupina]KAF6219648.1 hypothetical protein HO133_004117 [Letharia lupina]